MRSFDFKLFIEWMADFKALSTISNLYIKFFNIQEKIKAYKLSDDNYLQRFLIRPIYTIINIFFVIGLALSSIAYLLIITPFSYKNSNNSLFLASRIISLAKDTLKHLILSLFISTKDQETPLPTVLDPSSNYGINTASLPSLKDFASFISYAEKINAIDGLKEFLKTARIKTGNLVLSNDPTQTLIQPEDGFSGYDFINLMINQTVKGITTDHLFSLINQAIYYSHSQTSGNSGPFQNALVRLLSIVITGTSQISEEEQASIDLVFKDFIATLSRGYGEQEASKTNKIPFNSGQILRAVSPELISIAKKYPSAAKPLINFILCTVYNYNQYNTKPDEKEFVEKLLSYAMENFSSEKISAICLHLGHSDVISFLRDIVYDENILQISKHVEASTKIIDPVEKAVLLKEIIKSYQLLPDTHPLAEHIKPIFDELNITLENIELFINRVLPHPDFDQIFERIKNELATLTKKDYIDAKTIKFLQDNIDGAALFIDRSLITSLDGDTSFFTSNTMIERHLEEERDGKMIDEEQEEAIAGENDRALALTHFHLQKEDSLKKFIKIVLDPETNLTSDFLLSLANIDQMKTYESKTGSIMKTIAQRFGLPIDENPLPFLNEHSLSISALQKDAGTPELFHQLSILLNHEKIIEFFHEKHPWIEKNLESASVLVSLLLTQILNIQPTAKDKFTQKEHLAELALILKTILRSPESRSLIVSSLELLGPGENKPINLKSIILNFQTLVKVLADSETIPSSILSKIFNRILESQRPLISAIIQSKIKRTRAKIEILPGEGLELASIEETTNLEINAFFNNIKGLVEQLIIPFEGQEEISQERLAFDGTSELKPSDFKGLLEFTNHYRQPLLAILDPNSQPIGHIQELGKIFLAPEKIDFQHMQKFKEDISSLRNDSILKINLQQKELFLESLKTYPEIIESIKTGNYSIAFDEFLLSSEKINFLPTLFTIQNYKIEPLNQYYEFMASKIIEKKISIIDLIKKIQDPELTSFQEELDTIPTRGAMSSEIFCQTYLSKIIKLEKDFLSKLDSIMLQKKIISSLLFPSEDDQLHPKIVDSLSIFKGFLFNDAFVQKISSLSLDSFPQKEALLTSLKLFETPLSEWTLDMYPKTKSLFDTIHLISSVYLDDIDEEETLITEESINTLLQLIKNIYDLLEIKNEKIDTLLKNLDESVDFEEKKSFVKSSLHFINSLNEKIFQRTHPHFIEFNKSLATLTKSRQALTETSFKLERLSKRTPVIDISELSALQAQETEAFSESLITHQEKTFNLLSNIGSIVGDIDLGGLSTPENLHPVIHGIMTLLITDNIPSEIAAHERSELITNISKILETCLLGLKDPEKMKTLLSNEPFAKNLTIALYATKPTERFEGVINLIAITLETIPEFKEALLENLLKIFNQRQDIQGEIISIFIKSGIKSQEKEIETLISNQIQKNKVFMRNLTEETKEASIKAETLKRKEKFLQHVNGLIDKIVIIFKTNANSPTSLTIEDLNLLLSNIGTHLVEGLSISDIPSLLKLISQFKKETLEILDLDSDIGTELKEIGKIFLQQENEDHSLLQSIRLDISELKDNNLSKDAAEALLIFNQTLEPYPQIKQAIANKKLSIMSGSLLAPSKIESLSRIFNEDTTSIRTALNTYYFTIATKISAKKTLLLGLISRLDLAELDSFKIELNKIPDQGELLSDKDSCKTHFEKMVHIEQDLLSKIQSLTLEKKIIHSLIFEEDSEEHRNLIQIFDFFKGFVLNNELISCLNEAEAAELRESLKDIPKALATFGQPFLMWNDQSWKDRKPLFDSLHLITRFYLSELGKESSTIINDENINQLISVIEKASTFLELDENVYLLLEHIKNTQSFAEKKEVFNNLLQILDKLNEEHLLPIHLKLTEFLKTSSELETAKQDVTESLFKLEQLEKIELARLQQSEDEGFTESLISSEKFNIQTIKGSQEALLTEKLGAHKEHLHSLLSSVGELTEAIGGEHLSEYFNTPARLQKLMSSVLKLLLKDKKVSIGLINQGATILSDLISRTQTPARVIALLKDKDFANHLSTALNPKSSDDFNAYIKVINDILIKLPELKEALTEEDTYLNLIYFYKEYIKETNSKSWLSFFISNDFGIINSFIPIITNAIKDNTLSSLAQKERTSLWYDMPYAVVGSMVTNTPQYQAAAAVCHIISETEIYKQGAAVLTQTAYKAKETVAEYATASRNLLTGMLPESVFSVSSSLLNFSTGSGSRSTGIKPNL